MAVLVIANPGPGTEGDAERWDKMMREVLPKEPGFIIHADGQQPDGTWRIAELWESREAFEAHFDKIVRPNLPPDADVDGSTQFLDLPNVIR
jgi:quinol monooxygenase YgiN